MAARDLQENDPDRYGMMLLSGMLLPKMQEVQEQAETLHEEIAEKLVQAWMAQDNVNPYDTMKMTGLRTQAEMEAEEEVIREVIHQMR
jgi:DNA-binding protein YbaB